MFRNRAHSVIDRSEFTPKVYTIVTVALHTMQCMSEVGLALYGFMYWYHFVVVGHRALTHRPDILTRGLGVTFHFWAISSAEGTRTATEAPCPRLAHRAIAGRYATLVRWLAAFMRAAAPCRRWRVRCERAYEQHAACVDGTTQLHEDERGP